MADEQLISKPVHPFFIISRKKSDVAEGHSQPLTASTPGLSHLHLVDTDQPSPKRLRRDIPAPGNLSRNNSTESQLNSNSQSFSPDTSDPDQNRPLSIVELNQAAGPTKPIRILTLDRKAGTIGPPPTQATTSKNASPNVTRENSQPQITTGIGSARQSRQLIAKIKFGSDEVSRARVALRINEILGISSSQGDTSLTTQLNPSRTSQPPVDQAGSKQQWTLAGAEGQQQWLVLPRSVPDMGIIANASPSDAKPQRKKQARQSIKDVGRLQPSLAFKQRSTQRQTGDVNTSVKGTEQGNIERSTTRSPPRKQISAFSGMQSSSFSTNKLGNLKTPGTKHAEWPWKINAHVHGNPSSRQSADSCHVCLGHEFPLRKAKSKGVHIAEQESIISCIASSLGIPSLKQRTMPLVDKDGFPIVHRNVRIPQRHFECGKSLQERILQQLRAPVGNGAGGDLDDGDADVSLTHPAIAGLYARLVTSQSAFDRHECETNSWVVKYAPHCAADVLQAGKEAVLLRDWLRKLKVHSVDTGTTDGGLATDRRKGSCSEPKKRKRAKLYNFIVGSDDEEDDLEELSDAENHSPYRPRTVIRVRDRRAIKKDLNSRLANVALISGPNGCGKTAALYAAAEELGYEIREINPGVRRSGKDVSELVEAMTLNHIVGNSKVRDKHAVDMDDRTNDRIPEDVSSQQRTMASFFKPKPNSKKASRTSKSGIVPQSDEKGGGSTQQKQSLIFLEEVDILYEQDKQFWASVISLIAKSKRPFVMTCNDESVVPLGSLNLHGIFRLSPPPADLAVDYMLLVAAHEGHALKREAVASLYQATQDDLRASLSHLNFWCQIGVGDRKGGSTWYYPHWTRGADMDEQGNKLRVISEDTYHDGMGWLCHDALQNRSDSNDHYASSLLSTSNRGNSLYQGTGEEIEILLQAWDFYNLDIGHWQDTIDMGAWAAVKLERDAANRVGNLNTLMRFSDFLDQMSDADVMSSGIFASPAVTISSNSPNNYHNRLMLDPTWPNCLITTRDDYTLLPRLLHAPTSHDHSNMSLYVATTIKSLARARLVQAANQETPGYDSPIGPLDEHHALMLIRSRHAHQLWDTAIDRLDLGNAFDPIAASEKQLFSTSSSLELSVFDGTLPTIVLDVAPYIRRIVWYDRRLQDERMHRSSLLCVGGSDVVTSSGVGSAKRLRTTRSAYSAMEGGPRKSTRRDKYFGNELNSALVERTGGVGWNDAVEAALRSNDAGEHN